MVIVFTLLLMTSCATDEAYRYYGKSERKAPKKKNEVTVYYKDPGLKYEPIADFQARGSSHLVEEFQKKAAEVGADAIIITITNESYDKNTEWAGDGVKNTQDEKFFLDRRIYGTAIVFKN